MKRAATIMCPLCQDDVAEPVELQCPCKGALYCLGCVLKWRLPTSAPWHEDSFIAFGKNTFAAPCPTCRAPLGLGMEGVRVHQSARPHEEWKLSLVMLSVMCMAVTDHDVHEVFEVAELHISDEELLELSRRTTEVKDLDAVAHYVLSKHRPLALLKEVVRLDSIDFMSRFLKYVGSYPWSLSFTGWMCSVMAQTSQWLSPAGVPYSSHCSFVAHFSKVMSENVCHDYEPYLAPLVDVLRTSRQTGTLTMHETILNCLAEYDQDEDESTIAGVDAIGVVALYLDDDVVGHKAARLLKSKRVTASILPSVHAMSCRRKYLHYAVMLVNKIENLPHNETTTMILEQLLKHIKRPVSHCRAVLTAIQTLTTESNAGAICESMGDVMRLWMECPAVNLDATLDMVKGYMWTQRNYASDEVSESE